MKKLIERFSSLVKGPNTTANDPQFTTPGSYFSFSCGGNLEDAGKTIHLGVGE